MELESTDPLKKAIDFFMEQLSPKMKEIVKDNVNPKH